MQMSEHIIKVSKRARGEKGTILLECVISSVLSDPLAPLPLAGSDARICCCPSAQRQVRAQRQKARVRRQGHEGMQSGKALVTYLGVVVLGAAGPVVAHAVEAQRALQ
jgi:hypothetical protein